MWPASQHLFSSNLDSPGTRRCTYGPCGHTDMQTHQHRSSHGFRKCSKLWVCVSPENTIATEGPSGKTTCDACMIHKTKLILNLTVKLRKLYKSILQSSSERVRNENPCWKKKNRQTSPLQRLSFSVIDTLAYLPWAKCTTQQLQDNFLSKMSKIYNPATPRQFSPKNQILSIGMKPECPQKVMCASGYIKAPMTFLQYHLCVIWWMIY